MDIIGLGTDLVECVRVRALIERHSETFLRRVYTRHEICICRSSVRSTEAYAGRWAAKEAVLKSLNVIQRASQRIDVEIRSLAGKPQRCARACSTRRLATSGIATASPSSRSRRCTCRANAISRRSGSSRPF